MELIERIHWKGIELAVIVRAGYSKPGLEFLTPDHYAQQLAYMRHPAGKKIDPHLHNEVPREVHQTSEALFIRRGKVRASLYGPDREYVASRVLEAGDVLLLVQGGHGFEVLEEAEIIEVKQGPYLADRDKVRFVPKE